MLFFYVFLLIFFEVVKINEILCINENDVIICDIFLYVYFYVLNFFFWEKVCKYKLILLIEDVFC